MAGIPGPGIGGDWIPLAPTQFSAGASSTALSIPNPASQSPAMRLTSSLEFVALLFAQGAAFWLRADGEDAVKGYTTALLLADQFHRYVYGLNAIRNVRFIQDAPGGALVSEFYVYRVPTTLG